MKGRSRQNEFPNNYAPPNCWEERERERERESGDHLVSCMHIAWFCMVNWKKTWGWWWDGFLRCVGEKDIVNASKRKVMVLNGEEWLEYEVHVEGIHLEHVPEFKYLGCILDESGTDEIECSRKVASGDKILCSCREPSDYTSFHKAAKRQCFHTIKHTINNQEKHNSSS